MKNIRVVSLILLIVIFTSCIQLPNQEVAETTARNEEVISTAEPESSAEDDALQALIAENKKKDAMNQYYARRYIEGYLAGRLSILQILPVLKSDQFYLIGHFFDGFYHEFYYMPLTVATKDWGDFDESVGIKVSITREEHFFSNAVADVATYSVLDGVSYCLRRENNIWYVDCTDRYAKIQFPPTLTVKDPTTVKSYFDFERLMGPNYKTTTELASQITVGMQYSEVAKILKAAGYSVGSGNMIYEWELENGNELRIFFDFRDKVVTDIRIEEKTTDS